MAASFSSSLLQSIDESITNDEGQSDFHPRTKRHEPIAEEDAESLRRAITLENSSTNSDSTKSTPISLHLGTNTAQKVPKVEPKSEGKSTSAKSKNQKIYGDEKKVREPNSPGGRIARFLNSIFNPRTKSRSTRETGSMMKSRSVNDTKTYSLSCLSRNQFSRDNNKNNSDSEKVVGEEEDREPSEPTIDSGFKRETTDSIRKPHETKKLMSCDSSDLFELEAIVVEELRVRGSMHKF